MHLGALSDEDAVAGVVGAFRGVDGVIDVVVESGRSKRMSNRNIAKHFSGSWNLGIFLTPY